MNVGGRYTSQCEVNSSMWGQEISFLCQSHSRSQIRIWPRNRLLFNQTPHYPMKIPVS
jgi:hypothetical protein